MTTTDANPDLAFKCLELCQLLASQGQGFSLTVNVGSTFSFSLDSRKKDASMETHAVQLKIVEKKKLTPSQKRRNLLRREKFLKRKVEEHQWKKEGEAFEKEAEATKAEENGRRISKAGTHCPLVGSDRGLPLVKCVSQPAVSPVSFTLVDMKEKYEAEKLKNKALEDFQIKHKQNMERMAKIVGDYKNELDKARKELKDAKGKK